MNDIEISAILAKAQAYDNRTVAQSNIAAWAEALDDVDFTAAMAAVTEHYRETTEWLMPSHVVKKVTDVQFRHRQTLKAAGPPDFPNGLTQREESEYRSRYNTLVCRGLDRDAATKETDAWFQIDRGNPIPMPESVRAGIAAFQHQRRAMY